MTSAAQPVAGLTFSRQRKKPKVPVIASVPIECVFWPEEDGWKGACAGGRLTVNGGDFEEAKQNMEVALRAHIGSVLRERKMAA
jgi:hypothetical protein